MAYDQMTWNSNIILSFLLMSSHQVNTNKWRPLFLYIVQRKLDVEGDYPRLLSKVTFVSWTNDSIYD